MTIAVIEGRYGKLDLNNRTNLRDGVARGLLDGLDPGDIVATAPLMRRLLLLSDIPGVVIGSTLSPGEAVGTTANVPSTSIQVAASAAVSRPIMAATASPAPFASADR